MAAVRTQGTADYVIVGAGSAGSVLAERLSADGRYSVAVVEYGGTDAGPFIQMPAALSYPMNMRCYDWGYRTEPEPNLDGRSLAAPRGKVLGGSSSINGMVYVRGHPMDFDTWERLGAAGWGARHVQPYFRRLEHVVGGGDAFRGRDGPMRIRRPEPSHPLDEAFIAAADQAGYRRTADYNGADQEGFGPLEQTISFGVRWSAARAYLRSALRREHVRRYRGLVTRILWRGDTATGIEYLHGGRLRSLSARREVLLCGSAFNSPKLLMQSGVGPAEHLGKLGIPVQCDRRGVGRNLQDHLEIYLQMRSAQPITLRRYMNPFAKALVAAQWLLTRTGVGASNHFESGGFVRVLPDADYPDAQYHFLPVAIRYDGSQPEKAHGFQVHVGPTRSDARGEVWLDSADPLAAPRIRFNYLSGSRDREAFRACIRLSRRIFAQPAFDAFNAGEISPGATCSSDEDIDRFVAREVESAYHPCGTCRMGEADDPDAVVDPECRVIGTEGLRVVDSSIFPTITNGNINAPTLMVAEKAADHILGGPILDPEPWP